MKLLTSSLQMRNPLRFHCLRGYQSTKEEWEELYQEPWATGAAGMLLCFCEAGLSPLGQQVPWGHLGGKTCFCNTSFHIT